jgi:hypothetical protein
VADAEKLTLEEPDGTVTEAGTVTALLLLESLTVCPPLPAAVFSVTVQLSVVVPVIDALAQVRLPGAGTPVPLRAITVVEFVEVPSDELLARVSEPESDPAAVGSNFTDTVEV